MTRRDFVKLGMAASGVAVCGGAGASDGLLKPNGAARLRVGILSDIHVTNKTPGMRDSNEYLLKALRYFDAEKVDAVLIAGDLFTSSDIRELEIVAETWYEVFPGDRGSDGHPVERLFVTGNHDLDDWLYHRRKDESKAECAAKWKGRAFAFDRETVWRRLFGEDYRPYYLKEVKGYLFLMRHWPSSYHEEKSPIEAAFAEYGKRLAKEKVFFYCQHEQADDTVNASWLLGGEKWGNGQDDGRTKKVLSSYPNCICLTGHNHNSLADERSIWQGEYTAVNCGCLVGWAFAGPGRENGHDGDSRPPVREMPEFDFLSVHQGLLMMVYENCASFRRLDFKQDGVLGPDWVVPLDTTIRPYGFTTRAKKSKPPCFPEETQVRVREIERGHDRRGNEHPQIEVSFPPVTSVTGGDRAHDYSVRMEMRIGDVVRTVDEKRVFSNKFMFAECNDTEDVRCLFARSQVPRERPVRFVVTPFNCWLKAGESIISEWMKFKDASKS